jgi:hypothetical protein
MLAAAVLLAVCGTYALADASAPSVPPSPPAASSPPAPVAPPAASAPAAPTGKIPPSPLPPPPAVSAPKSAPYSDVPAKHPAAAAVQSLKDKNMMGPKEDGKFHGSDYVTRYELAVILDRFITYNENEHKPIKQTKVPGPYVVSAPSGHWAHDSQVKLVSEGFVPKASPILSKPGDARVTEDQLTEALSEVMIRLSDRELPVTLHDTPLPNTAPAN